MVDTDDMDWLTLRSQFKRHTQGLPQSAFSKVLDKCSEYWFPAVAVGAFSTTGALALGMYKCVAGKGRTSQVMMRTRVIAQGFTLAALIMGCLNANKSSEDFEPPPLRAMAKAIPIPVK